MGILILFCRLYAKYLSDGQISSLILQYGLAATALSISCSQTPCCCRPHHLSAFWRHGRALVYLFKVSIKPKTQNPPWEPNIFSASREISRILWGLQFCYNFHEQSAIISYLKPYESAPSHHFCYNLTFYCHLYLDSPSFHFTSATPNDMLQKLPLCLLPSPLALHI
jgi:hypothetical protein